MEGSGQWAVGSGELSWNTLSSLASGHLTICFPPAQGQEMSGAKWKVFGSVLCVVVNSVLGGGSFQITDFPGKVGLRELSIAAAILPWCTRKLQILMQTVLRTWVDDQPLLHL